MLTNTNSREVIHIRYADVVPTTAFVLNFPTKGAYEFLSVRHAITAAAAIVIPGVQVQDNSGNIILVVSTLPWLVAATSVESTTGQTPDPSLTPLFAPAIAGFINSGLHVFNGWRLQWSDFLGTPGVTFDGDFIFARAEYDDSDTR